MDAVHFRLDLSAQGLERLSLAIPGTRNECPRTMAPRPKGRARQARSHEPNRMWRLVTTAAGTIGRPENRASVRMPASQRRVTFGTSELKATDSPAFSALIIARRPSAPPLERVSPVFFRPRAPEARITRTPRRSRARVLMSPSGLREMIVATRSPGRRISGMKICWPCHIPAITGSCVSSHALAAARSPGGHAAAS